MDNFVPAHLLLSKQKETLHLAARHSQSDSGLHVDVTSILSVDPTMTGTKQLIRLRSGPNFSY